MLTLQIIIAIAVFLIFLWADTIHPLFSSGMLFFLYLWGALVFDFTTIQKVFYPIGLLFYIACKGYPGFNLPTNATRTDVNGKEKGGVISGGKYHLFSILIGVAMLVIMFAITSQKGQFLGVAPLAISSAGFGAWATAQFAPAISLSLGFIENRMFISLLNILLLPSVILSLVPFVSLFAFLAPVLVTAIAFGLFHIIAYKVAWSMIIWASVIMGMWIMSYYMTGEDTTAMDVSHGAWNGILTSKETLSVAF
ncbi:hypothetical protein ACFL43_04160 [Thermodesulfobacteriota bacterium]